MSQLNYLEKLLDGAEVEWKTLGTLTTDSFWIMPATPKFDENEKIPYITSKNIRGGHINFEKTKYISYSDYLSLSKNRPILAGDILISMIGTIGEVARVKDTDLEFYGQNMYLIRLNETLINSDYFLHFFDSPRMKGHFSSVKNNSGQGYLKANDIDKLTIPIPSLKVQNKVVQILDTFSPLTAELTVNLNTESLARKKQYNYYREQLLTFNDEHVQWEVLEDIIELKRGKRLVKSQLEKYGDYAVYQNSMTPLGYYHEFNVKSDTAFIISAGAAGEIGYSKVDFWAADDVYFFITPDNINDKFLYYFLLIKKYKILSQVRRASIPRLSRSVIEKLEIPIPPLLEQQRIVDILDKFDALTTSLTEGLPREIELRQQQYEYYRELLLSFPKVENDA